MRCIQSKRVHWNKGAESDDDNRQRGKCDFKGLHALSLSNHFTNLPNTTSNKAKVKKDF